MTFQPGTYAILKRDLTLNEVKNFATTFNAAEDRVRPVVMTAQPAFNPTTQRVVQNGWSINANDATPIWQVIALTQAELDEIADAAMIETLKTLSTQFIAGTGTTAQVREALGKLIKHLGKKGVIP